MWCYYHHPSSKASSSSFFNAADCFLFHSFVSKAKKPRRTRSCHNKKKKKKKIQAFTKQSITVRLEVGVRWQHCVNRSKAKASADSSLQCHSNQNGRADRQKTQINALFLLGLERSWWRGALSTSCWLLATCTSIERSPSALRRQNQIADGDFSGRDQPAPLAPNRSFEPCPASLICILIGCLDVVDVKHGSIRFSPGVRCLLLTSTLNRGKVAKYGMSKGAAELRGSGSCGV